MSSKKSSFENHPLGHGLLARQRKSLACQKGALAINNEPAYRAAVRPNRANKCALRLSVRTTAFHVVKTGSTPVGRTKFLQGTALA